MEITITNFNQIQGDEFDQIGKIFAADLHTFLINYEVQETFFLFCMMDYKVERDWPSNSNYVMFTFYIKHLLLN